MLSFRIRNLGAVLVVLFALLGLQGVAHAMNTPTNVPAVGVDEETGFIAEPSLLGGKLVMATGDEEEGDGPLKPSFKSPGLESFASSVSVVPDLSLSRGGSDDSALRSAAARVVCGASPALRARSVSGTQSLSGDVIFSSSSPDELPSSRSEEAKSPSIALGGARLASLRRKSSEVSGGQGEPRGGGFVTPPKGRAQSDGPLSLPKASHGSFVPAVAHSPINVLRKASDLVQVSSAVVLKPDGERSRTQSFDGDVRGDSSGEEAAPRAAPSSWPPVGSGFSSMVAAALTRQGSDDGYAADGSLPPVCSIVPVSSASGRRGGPSLGEFVKLLASEVAREMRGSSIASRGSRSSSSGSESDGEIDWLNSTEFVSPTGKPFKNIKTFETICKSKSSSFILFKSARYCVLVGSDSKGPDAPGTPPPCLQVLLILNPKKAKELDCEYWTDYTKHDSCAWAYSNMLATSLEFLGKKLCVLSPISSRSERENGGEHTATIGSPHRHFWSTHLSPSVDGENRRVELDEACLLLNSQLWNQLFSKFVKKMWNRREGCSRDSQGCWDYLLKNNHEFAHLVEKWHENYHAYFCQGEVADATLSRLVSLFPQREGWTGERPFWLNKDGRWL